MSEAELFLKEIDKFIVIILFVLGLFAWFGQILTDAGYTRQNPLILFLMLGVSLIFGSTLQIIWDAEKINEKNITLKPN